MFAAALLLALHVNAAQIQITGADVPRSTRMEYFSSGIERQPASSSVQRLNPPIFGWMYYEDPWLLQNSVSTNYTETRVFRHKLWTNGVSYWSKTVSNNFYNFFGCITNADGSTFTGTCSWSIEYWNSNNTVLLGTNALHTFTMAADAEQWDRSCFADTTFLNSFSNVHPRILVKSTNVEAFRSFIHGATLNSVMPNVSFGTYTGSISTPVAGVPVSYIAPTNRMVWFGNSITALGGSDAFGAVVTSIGNPWSSTNFAVSSKTSWDIFTDQLTPGAAELVPTCNRNFAHVLEGGNSIYFSNAASAALLADIAFKDYTNVCARLRASNFWVIACTIPNRNDLLIDATKAAAVTNFNNLVFSNYADFAYQLIRYDTNALLDPIAHPENYDGDQIHPNVNGKAIYAQMATNALKANANYFWSLDPVIMTNSSSWRFGAAYIAQMGAAYWGVTNAWFSNALNNASPSVGAVLTNIVGHLELQGVDQKEVYQGDNISSYVSLAIAKDCFHHLMTAGQVSALRRFIMNWAAFEIFCDWYYTGSTTNVNRDYFNTTNLHVIAYPSIAKQGESHMRHDRAGLTIALEELGDDPNAATLLEYFLNYYIARFDPYNYSGEDPRVYGAIDTFLDVERSMTPWYYANMMFYDRRLTNAPVYNELADVVMFQTPTGFRSRAQAWGPRTDPNAFFQGKHPWSYRGFAAFSCMQARGDYYRQHLRSADSTLAGGGTDELNWLCAIVAPFYWPKPTEIDRSTNSFIDPVRGWAAGLSGYPTDWGAYSNGVGFVFQARPTGTGRNSGGNFTDGSIEMWAYGAHLTDFGEADHQEVATLLGNGLFVDGIGVNNQNPAIVYPVHARFDAYTNFGSGVWVRGDLTYAFNISNYVGGGAGNLQSVPNSAALHDYLDSTNARPYISSVKRGVLFLTNGLTILYDTFSTTQAAQFQWKWNSYPTNSTFNWATMALTYTTTNNFTGRSNVTALVQHIVNPASLIATQMLNTENVRGSNELCYAKMNPFSGEKYNYTNDWYAGMTDTQFYWASTLWVANATQTTNWHFMSVIAPSFGDNNLWQIGRLDDYTFTATNTGTGWGGIISADTNNFTGGSGAYAATATFVFDPEGTNAPPVIPTGLTSLTFGSGKAKGKRAR